MPKQSKTLDDLFQDSLRESHWLRGRLGYWRLATATRRPCEPIGHEILMSEMGNVSGKEAHATRVPFVAGVIYGSQEARTDDLLRAAEKAHEEFSTVKAFWKV